MAKMEILILIALVTLVICTEIDDEYKKRGIGKANGVNTIPTGSQKSDYTYSIYPHTSQSNQNYHPPTTYSNQVSNSLYPNQGNNQYQAESIVTETPTHSAQPQLNVVPHQTSTPFLPQNFVPNPGYQTKYQLISPKPSTGNIQLVLQPSSSFPSSFYYPQSNFPNPTTTNNGSPILSQFSPHGQLNFGSNYPTLSLSPHFLGHPPMVLFPQFSPPTYNNLVYPTPGQNVYYPTNSQNKQNYSYVTQPAASENYEKSQGSSSQSISKDENDISAQSSEYNPTKSVTSYKNIYMSRSYTKK